MKRSNIRFTTAIAFVAVLFLCLSVVGCKDDPYTVCAKATDDIAKAVSDSIATTKDLYKTGLIDQNERNAVLGILGNVVDVNTEFRNNVRDIHTNPAAGKAVYLQAASKATTSAENLLASGALHVKNPQAAARLGTVLKAIKIGLDGIAVAIQNAKGT